MDSDDQADSPESMQDESAMSQDAEVETAPQTAGAKGKTKKIEYVKEAERALTNYDDTKVYMHRPRLSEKDQKSKCFVCNSSTKDGESLTQCQKTYAKNILCKTKFHMSCLREYNAGAFVLDYMRLHTHIIQCPLHHCDPCWFDRNKTSAPKGEIVECQSCYKAFHKKCTPAGMPIRKMIIKGSNSQAEINVVTCHFHAPASAQPQISAKQHFHMCCECSELGTDENPLDYCRRCIRSYHKGCHKVTQVDGTASPMELCESCIHGETIRIGQKVIVRYQASFYAGITVDNSWYPTGKNCKGDRLAKYLGKPGYMPVLWAGCNNIYGMAMAAHVVPMFSGSYDFFGHRVSDKDYRNGWKEMEEQGYLTPDKPYFDSDELEVTIKSSIYHPTCEVPKMSMMDIDEMKCTCKENEKDRCGPSSGCTNRGSGHECPPGCEKQAGGCNNQCVRNKVVNPNMEKKSAGRKGYGVFATGRIPSGAHVAEYAGEIIANDEKEKRLAISRLAKNDEEKHYMMELDGQRTVDARYKGNIGRYLNHSCDPNCKVELLDIIVSVVKPKSEKVKYDWQAEKVKYDRRIVIRTIREVNKGDELTFDYRMSSKGVGMHLPECQCGSDNCKGRLGIQEPSSPEVAVAPVNKRKRALPSIAPKAKRSRKRILPISDDQSEEVKKYKAKNGPNSHLLDISVVSVQDENTPAAPDEPPAVISDPLKLPSDVKISLQRRPSRSSFRSVPPICSVPELSSKDDEIEPSSEGRPQRIRKPPMKLHNEIS